MLRRRFGGTEIRMPVLSCGGMRYQESWDASEKVSEESQRNLEAVMDRAFELGIVHFETARGYGTSEVQLGSALKRLPRDRVILQTKVSPREDPRQFERELRDSLERLEVEYLDLFAFHGINNRQRLEQTLRPGGCHDVARRFQRQGRIRHIGFSTHATTSLIVEAIRSGCFEYVNLHWYYIFQDNRPALEAAAARDMGVFIISPSDKGGRLYDPSRKLAELCRPLSPMVFNDLFCLSQPWIHTIPVGAARPADFDEHLKVLPHLDSRARTPGPSEILQPIIERLEATYRAALGGEFAATWSQGIPEWRDIPGGINVQTILWLRNLVVAFDLLGYARRRYNMLGKDDHWFPGDKADNVDDRSLMRCLRGSPHASRIPDLLREAHEMLSEESDA